MGVTGGCPFLEEGKESMKIYFAGSIRGGRDDASIYAAMIAWLRSFGEVLTEHVGNPSLSDRGDDGPDDQYIHDRDMAWLSACDCVVAEVSVPSLGVGYELGWAASSNKPVLCLHRSASGWPLSAMIAGSSRMQVAAYSSMDEAKTIMTEFMRQTAETMSRSTSALTLRGDGP